MGRDRLDASRKASTVATTSTTAVTRRNREESMESVVDTGTMFVLVKSTSRKPSCKATTWTWTSHSLSWTVSGTR